MIGSGMGRISGFIVDPDRMGAKALEIDGISIILGKVRQTKLAKLSTPKSNYLESHRACTAFFRPKELYPTVRTPPTISPYSNI